VFQRKYFRLTNVTADSFDANWISNDRIAIAAGLRRSGAPPVHREVLDINSGANTAVVQNIGQGSGGVAIDGTDNLYVGDVTTGWATGTVKAFCATDWKGALAAGKPLDFAKEETIVADLLGLLLGFDKYGNN